MVADDRGSRPQECRHRLRAHKHAAATRAIILRQILHSVSDFARRMA